MSATDRLRALLDERGVEWWAEDDPEDPPYYLVTKWFSNANEQTFEEIPAIRSRSLKAFCLTPEQAIDATLGRGTCEVECFDDGTDEGLDGGTFSYAPPTWYLSCGHEVYGSERPCYCSTCGRRVV